MSIFCSAVRYLHHSTKNSQLINFVKQSTCCYLLTDVFNFILFSISFYYSRAFASKKKQKQIHRINTFCRVCVHVQTLHNHHSYGRATNKLAMCVFFFFRCVFCSLCVSVFGILYERKSVRLWGVSECMFCTQLLSSTNFVFDV